MKNIEEFLKAQWSRICGGLKSVKARQIYDQCVKRLGRIRQKDIRKPYIIAGCVAFVLLLIIIAGVVLRSCTVEEKNPPEPNKTGQEETSGEAVTSEAVISDAVVTPEPGMIPETEGPRKAYLTFDDGTSEQTDKILDILAKYGVKATFFVCARGGEANAARYKRIVEEGHSIGLHSVSHKYKEVYASLDSYIADVEGIRKFVLDTTGYDTHLYRFPGGSSNSVSTVPMEECIRYLNQNGYRYFDWNIDSSDAVNRKQTPQELAARVLGREIDTYHNCVILMHDAAAQAQTVEALPAIIEGILARGMEILPITDNTPVVQHKKATSVQ